MQRKILIAASLLALMGPTARADNTMVFGMELQKPFSVPECLFTHIGKTVGYYNAPATGVCYERLNDADRGIGKPISNDTVNLTWPTTGSPQLVIGHGMATVIDGNLEGVHFNTLGIQSQDRDFTALKDKYGAPTETAQATMQNAYGAQFTSIRASWTMGNVVVSFDSAPGRINSGLIHVETLKSIAARNAFFDNLHKGKPSL